MALRTYASAPGPFNPQESGIADESPQRRWIYRNKLNAVETTALSRVL
jgi:hypothetical protein